MSLWIFTAALAGGIWRVLLGGYGNLSRVLLMIVGALAIFALTYAASGTLLLALATAGLTTLGWSLGHGSYMDMGINTSPDNEILSSLLTRVGLKDPSYTRDFIGMWVLYSLWMIPLAAMYYFIWSVAFWPVVFMALVPLLIAAMYAIANKIIHWGGYMGQPTVVGEAIAGALVYGSIALALI